MLDEPFSSFTLFFRCRWKAKIETHKKEQRVHLIIYSSQEKLRAVNPNVHFGKQCFTNEENKQIKV